MTPDELKNMEKTVKKAKRIATEKAGELHDLVEDRLPAAFEEIPGIAQATYDACKAWADAEAAYKSAEALVAEAN
ncbi:MAG: CCE_0567 family metalloprotein [Gammaproteobacteria bacterium]